MGEGVNEGRIRVMLAPDTTLGDIESISWWVNTTSGYPPHVDLLLDLDGDGSYDGGKKDLVTGGTLSGNDDVLVAEFAYQPYLGPGYAYSDPGVPYGHYAPDWQGNYYFPSYNTWVQTFQNDTIETDTTQLNNDTVLWLYSGLSGPYDDGYFGSLADFKEGTVQVIGGTDIANVNKDTKVLEIQIEVDNWLGPADAYIDDITINGELVLSELHPPEIEVEEPEARTYSPGSIPVNISTHDLFGVSSVWYNVKRNTGDWVYASNRTYTSPTSMLAFVEGDYQIFAWAENNLGVVGKNSDVRFSVRSGGTIIDIKPETLNLKSRGRWITVHLTPPEGYGPDDIDINSVKFEFNDEQIDVEWGNIQGGALMVKFSRSEVSDVLSPGENVEITISGELEDDTPFGGSDTIRIIKPGKALGSIGKIFGLEGGSGKNKGYHNKFKGGPGKGHGKPQH
jgi:hypothetical protein